MKSHPVISVIHLEQAKEDPFQRTVPATPVPLIENGEEVFVVEKILKERTLDGTKELLVKWKGWDKLT